MPKYLKKFKTQAAYEAAQSGLILPNVSLTVDSNTVHYNPWVETRVVAKYNVTSTSNPTQIGYNQYTSGFSSIEIDGVKQQSVVSAYTFSTTGEHTVEYTLAYPTSIGESAFYQCSSLISIDIPSGVTSIGLSAFSYCTSLTSINIPSGVTSIGNAVFYNCSSLTSINIPSGVTSIGSSTFRYCSSLASITCNATTAPTIQSNTFRNVYKGGTLTVPSGSTGYNVWMGTGDYYLGKYNWNLDDGRRVVAKYNVTDTTNPTSIGYNQYTSGFSAIEIDGVIQPSVVSAYTFSTTGEHTVKYKLAYPTSIGEGAFASCTSLTSIEIPSGVTSIGLSAFWGCSGLTNVNIPNSVTDIGYENFCKCSSLTSIDIPDTVTGIGTSAFAGCSSLTSIEIPSGVTDIGPSAFDSCSSLTSITCNRTIAPTIRSSTFRYVKTGGTLYVPQGSTGYDVWMGTGDYYLGKYNWTKVEQ